MVATADLGDLVSGFVLGVFVGLLVGPALRFRLARREWTQATREAQRTLENFHPEGHPDRP